MFTRENLPQVFDSILIAITKVKGHVEQEDYDQTVQTFIVDYVKKASWNLNCCDIKLVDPLMQHCGKISQSCQSEELWQSILSLRPLENGFNMFTPSLLDCDERDFVAIHQHLEELIRNNMAARNFLQVVQVSKLLRSIWVLGQTRTQESMHRSMQYINGRVKSMCSAAEASVRLDAAKKLSFRQDFSILEGGCAVLDACFDDSFPPEQRPSALFAHAKNSIFSLEAEIQHATFIRDISKPGEIHIADLKFALQNLQSKRLDRCGTLHGNTDQLETMQAICSLAGSSSDRVAPHDVLKNCHRHLCACADLQVVATHVRKLCNLFDGVAIEISNRELVFCNPETAPLLTFLRETPLACVKCIQMHVKDHLTMLQENNFKSAMSSLSQSAPLIISSHSSVLSALIDLFLGFSPRPFSISILKGKQYGFDVQSIIQVEAAAAYFEAMGDHLDCSVVIQSFFAKLESDSRTEASKSLKKSSLKDIQDFISPIHREPKLRIAMQNLDQLRRLDPSNFASEPSRLLLRQRLVEQPLKELQSAIRNPETNYREVVCSSVKVMDLLAELCTCTHT